MAQHFLLSAAARTLSLLQVMQMSETEAWQTFRKVRWPDTDGEPVCPRCDCQSCRNYPRRNGALRFRCTACEYDFSPTSGTLFAHHKLPIRTYLAAIAIFCNEVKGKNALALSREAMGAARKGQRIGGTGRIAEVDGAWFGGHVRPENRKAERKDRRLSGNRNDKRQCVVLICERPAKPSCSEAIGRHKPGAKTGRTLATVTTSEEGAMGFIKARLDRGTTVHADEAAAWNELHARFDCRNACLISTSEITQACQPLRRICER
ncbi:MAG: transposase [Alphaproteobacteria bacterium]